MGGTSPGPAGWSPRPGRLGAAWAPVPAVCPGSAQTPMHPPLFRTRSHKVDSGTWLALPGADSSRQCSAERQTPAPLAPQQQTSENLAGSGSCDFAVVVFEQGMGARTPPTPPTLPSTRRTPGFQEKLRKPEAELSTQGRSCGGRGEAGGRGQGSRQNQVQCDHQQTDGRLTSRPAVTTWGTADVLPRLTPDSSPARLVTSKGPGSPHTQVTGVQQEPATPGTQLCAENDREEDGRGPKPSPPMG